MSAEPITARPSFDVRSVKAGESSTERGRRPQVLAARRGPPGISILLRVVVFAALGVRRAAAMYGQGRGAVLLHGGKISDSPRAQTPHPAL